MVVLPLLSETTYDTMTVNLRTMVATFPQGALKVGECNNNWWEGLRTGEFTIDLTGTPFQLAKVSELTLNTNYDYYKDSTLGHKNTGPFYLSGWNTINRVNCSTVQRCSEYFDGRCASTGIWNFDETVTSFDSTYAYGSLQNTVAKLEYVNGYEDDCSGVANTAVFDIGAYLAEIHSSGGAM
jgi:hypothetical protein